MAVSPSDLIGCLLRPELSGLEPYVPIHPFEVVSQRLGRPPEQIVKLDANENPYGPSPRAVEAIARYPWLHIYPDPQSTELREALADYLGVPADRILVGNGADELIDLIGRLVLAPGDAMLDCPPTFGMYAFCAAVNGATLINVPRRPDFSVDVDALERLVAPEPAAGYDDLAWLDAGRGDARLWLQPDSSEDFLAASGPDHRTISHPHDPTNSRPHELTLARPRARTPFPRPKLLFLCSPNNPDGGLLPAADLERLLRLPLLVVVDEAYIEFARPGASFVPWVADHSNLVVLRTFSKWAGLGGLRVGYGVFPPAIIEQLWKIKPPYNVNVAGSRAAIASLADRDYLLGNVAKLVAERDRLYAELARFPFLQPIPGSQSNFVLCRVLGRDARQLKLDLEGQGVLVRHFAKPGVDNCIRISVGRPEHTDALLDALERAMCNS